MVSVVKLKSWKGLNGRGLAVGKEVTAAQVVDRSEKCREHQAHDEIGTQDAVDALRRYRDESEHLVHDHHSGGQQDQADPDVGDPGADFGW